ncbi:MAG TPA: LacI family DNA-binding transcriptional regulator [Acidobacteriaceae bacterium]|jgi:LacI family transcriptional regulator|nr:LacI family DNA-binding transcriptional regulator [Acidobacteriaceae bacterium]
MIPKTNNPTLVDVAREADVSLKTASRVLNNAPGLAPATARRVRAVMSKIGYRPNELARSLKGRKSAAIGMVVPNLADPFSASAVQAVQEVARKNGHVVILTSSGGDEALEREELETLVRRQVDGLVIAPADGRRNTTDSFASANIPVVAFDRPFSNTSIDSITVSNSAAVREATEHLLSHGYQRILAVGARPHLYTGSERIAGYASTMKRAGLEQGTYLVENESELTPEVIRTLLTRNGKKMEAILTLNGITTMMILRGLRHLGVRVARDIALISFDDFQLAEILTPGLTVVRQPAEDLGRRAAELLFTRMESKKPLPQQKIVLSTTFHIRESCGCPERREQRAASLPRNRTSGS